MKLLLLIFLITSVNVYASTKLSIVNDEGQPMSKQFDTEIEADAYTLKLKHKWGKDKGWYKSTCKDAPIETRVVQEMGSDITEYHCNATYSAIKSDTTVATDAKKVKKDADDLSIEAIKLKLVDGSAKLDDIINYIKIKDSI